MLDPNQQVPKRKGAKKKPNFVVGWLAVGARSVDTEEADGGSCAKLPGFSATERLIQAARYPNDLQ